ncbi:alpha/beta hydrolase [Alkalibacterium thalassium]|uniref:S-formylglutathione hydrolase FrmB n=1 Tax=Alkalibacterium thalassium TaxID=426701 RepID=A0A1G9C8K4_9LACT|nr:hypothetical protein [Alkalibacterium thalassium]SDK47725.1 S-formylglutathione hydrolase FrmB [Alkalibacterium thalassium]
MTIIDASFFSENLTRKVSFSAIIPEKNRASGALQTLYLLHGYSGDCKDWLYAGQIEQLADNYGIAVILPNGENSYYVDHPNGLGYGALRNGLYYDQTFSKIAALSSRILTRKPEDSTHTYPDRIMKVLIGSDKTADIPDEMDLYHLAENSGQQPALYMACGTSDFLYKDNVEFHAFLKQADYPHQYVEDEGDHNWEFWNQQIILALDWLTEKEQLNT